MDGSRLAGGLLAVGLWVGFGAFGRVLTARCVGQSRAALSTQLQAATSRLKALVHHLNSWLLLLVIS